MYYYPYGYPYHNMYYGNPRIDNFGGEMHYYPYNNDIMGRNRLNYNHLFSNRIALKDYGANPFVININEASEQNNNYRTVLWTGDHLQVALMSLNPGEDIGLEIHPDVDQFLRIEQGQGIVQMGKSKDNLSFKRNVYEDSAIMVPARTWHNLTNIGNTPLKLYTIYAPPNHPFGTVHTTKAEAIETEH
ncbi:cupin domain-containing protein [Ureibacillus sp. Re31]|uniref:Cupin domain-containing protein n=2 Tax=Bacillales TaxID=1385 RepID=A0A3M8H1A3_9BACI|nr:MULTISPECIES: cupin domain-containing protein [Bacillales]MBD8026406.1 cupin domain-containing protein [Ureibacillus galli]RNC96257.1 cupin domain-containing protein [Lysinibacillus halotolerans]